MTDCLNELSFVETSTLLNYYGFELKGWSPHQLVERWQQSYSTYWVRLAVIESLYQGRYKAISVEHILDLWSRKGHPTFHFTHDFERLICFNLAESAELSANNPPISNNCAKPSLKPITPKTPVTLTPLYQFFPEMEMIASEPELGLTESEIPTAVASPEPRLELISVRDGESEQVAIANDPNADAPKENEPAAIPPPDRRSFNTAWPSGKTIRGFIPRLDESELYSKLRAVVHQELAAKTGG
jgi:hypothetical protein